MNAGRRNEEQGHAFHLWTAERVYFAYSYDRLNSYQSVPGNAETGNQNQIEHIGQRI